MKNHLFANYISHLERANIMVSMSVLMQIIKTLEVTVDNVLCDSIPIAIKPYMNEIMELEEDCSEKKI